MPQPAHFKHVFTSVIGRYTPGTLSCAALAEKLVEALDLADAIMGNTPVSDPPRREPIPRAGVLIQTPAPAYPSVDFSQGQVIGARIVEEAPPAAVVRNPDAEPTFETREETERKKSVLHSTILQKLPQALTVDLPALGRELTLVRFVKPSPAGMNFIRVAYAQHADEEDGPQIQLSTADAGVDVEAIKIDILSQAAMRYRAQKPKIIPRAAPPTGFPDTDNLKITPQNSVGSGEQTSSDDMASWRATVPVTPGT